jgi:uncharacterized protein YajQ (UPF0234 family)
MEKLLKLNLQLFAGEGASGTGDGGGEGATSGENATAAAEQRLRELGVPEDRIRKRASKVASKMPAPVAETKVAEPKAEETKVESATTENKPTTEDTKDQTPSRMSWDEIMKDPEYNKEMQAIIRSRLKTEKSAEEALGKVTPTLELLARKYNLDPTNIDYEALNKAVSDDDSYYEDKALEMGVSVETAKKVDQMERDTERKKAEDARNLQDEKIRNHFISLERQSEAMKKVFPNFDLRTELQNPAFARMTSPNVGISVEDAYYAIHRNEIQTAAMQVTAQKTAEKISNAIQSGSRRPDESGTSSQAPSVSTFDYAKASREQREAFKKDLRMRMARGEKVYPGQR